MQGNRTLIAAGGIGAAIAAICCVTPLLAVVFGALGLAAWLGRADYVLIPALFICLVLLGGGLSRRRSTAQACCNPAAPQQGRKS